IDRRALRAVGERLEGLGIADLRVHEILPEMYARAMPALGIRHPRAHLGHAAHVDTHSTERLLDQALGGGDARARLAREEQDPQAQAARIDAIAPRRL